MKTTRTLMLAGSAAFALALAACGSSGGGTANAPGSGSSSHPAASGTSVKVRSTGLGAVLTDPSGKTLYLLTADTPTTAACTGGCLGIWMPLAAPSSGQPQAGSGVNVALGVFTRTDGTKQVTIGGHQLYTYSGDAAAGDTAGQGINSYGGIWYTVSSHGVAILGTSGGSSPTPTTGYGY